MSQLGNILERPKLYNNIDGVGELSMGFMMLSWGLLMYLQAHSPAHAVWHTMYAFVIYMAAMVSIMHYGTRAIKNHITYPRTGFVEYRKQYAVRSQIAAAIVAALAAVGLSLASRHHWDITASVPLYFVLFAAGYAYGIARTVRWKWIVAAAMALGSLLIALLPAGAFDAIAADSSVTHPIRTRLVGAFLLTLLLYGAMLLISGAVTFYLYLRRTEPQ